MKHLLIALLTLVFALPSNLALATLTQTEVSQLYVGAFGRASEGEGNSYWQTDTYSTSMTATANVMLDTDSAKEYFGTSLDNSQDFIEHIYSNTLGKTYSEDPTGIDYWVSELDGGKSKGAVISALIDAAQHSDNAGAAQDRFNNKVTVSNYCADTIYKSTGSLETFKGFISAVTDADATVVSSKTLIKADALPTSLSLQWETVAGKLNVPESVIHDSSKSFIYAGNMNTPSGGDSWIDNGGFISKLNENGDIIEESWVTGLMSPKGMTINGNSLYIADLNTVVEINTVDGTISNVFYAPSGTDHLNDISFDSARGVMYVSDYRDKQILEVTTNGSFSLFYDKETEDNPAPYQNGLYVDGDYLIMTSQRGVVKSINIETKVVESISSGLDTSIDGIWNYKDLGYFISDNAGKIYFVGNDGVASVLLTTAPTYSADISYSPELNVILVPDFNDKVIAYEVIQ